MKKLLISFSGGETSAFMAQWLWRNKQDEFDMIFVFANTGEENEETLAFVQKCSDEFGFPVVWIEAKVNHENGKGTSFKEVTYETASRKGQPFEDVISKYGIPNQAYPHCTRELKQIPIEKYAKSIGWNDYYTAIGIRADEADRINEKARERKFIYPLISNGYVPMTKIKINFWWKMQPFRLDLKGYQGNCKWCWKKSYKKLYKLAQESLPESRTKTDSLPIRFFRKNKSVEQIIEESKTAKKIVKDDSNEYNYQLDLIGGDSCEVYAECGS